MSDPLSGFVKLYHPRGPLVTLPVPLAAPGDMLACVTAYLDAGWLGQAPGLEKGEHRDDFGFVVRRSKENQDRSVTPVVDLYLADEGMKFAFLTVYLNTDADVRGFEVASGLRLTDVPHYVGDNKIERGKKRETDALVTRAPRPFGVVWMPNPKWVAEDAEAHAKKGEAYPVPKRKFVRWADQPAQPAQAAHGGAGATQNISGRAPAGGGPERFSELYRSLDKRMDEAATEAALYAVGATHVRPNWAKLTGPEQEALVAKRDARQLSLRAATAAAAARPQPAGQPAPRPQPPQPAGPPPADYPPDWDAPIPY